MTTRLSEASIARRCLNMIARGTLSKAHDNYKLQQVDLKLLRDETKNDVEFFHQFGFTSVPKPGAEAIVLFPGGNRSHGIVIAIADRRYRLTGLEEGDVAFHDDSGQAVKLTRNGIVIETAKSISVKSETGIILEAPEVNINGAKLTHNGTNIGDDHTHRDVKAGDDRSGTPKK